PRTVTPLPRRLLGLLFPKSAPAPSLAITTISAVLRPHHQKHHLRFWLLSRVLRSFLAFLLSRQFLRASFRLPLQIRLPTHHRHCLRLERKFRKFQDSTSVLVLPTTMQQRVTLPTAIAVTCKPSLLHSPQATVMIAASIIMENHQQ